MTLPARRLRTIRLHALTVLGLLTAGSMAGLTAGGPSAQAAPPGVRYVFPVVGCSASYGRSHHDYPASDIFAKRGCKVVSVTAGRVDEVSRVDRWSSRTNAGATRGGLSVSVVGNDGVRYYYSHFSAIPAGIKPGVRVAAGTALGAVGNTGSARGTATHVHFGLSWPTGPGKWWIRRGEVQPAPYLDAWRAGKASSPYAAVKARARQRGGENARCTAAC